MHASTAVAALTILSSILPTFTAPLPPASAAQILELRSLPSALEPAFKDTLGDVFKKGAVGGIGNVFGGTLIKHLTSGDKTDNPLAYELNARGPLNLSPTLKGVVGTGVSTVSGDAIDKLEGLFHHSTPPPARTPATPAAKRAYFEHQVRSLLSLLEPAPESLAKDAFNGIEDLFDHSGSQTASLLPNAVATRRALLEYHARKAGSRPLPVPPKVVPRLLPVPSKVVTLAPVPPKGPSAPPAPATPPPPASAPVPPPAAAPAPAKSVAHMALNGFVNGLTTAAGGVLGSTLTTQAFNTYTDGGEGGSTTAAGANNIPGAVGIGGTNTPTSLTADTTSAHPLLAGPQVLTPPKRRRQCS